MSGQTLRKKFMVRLTGMTRYSRWYAWAIVGFYMALISVGVVLGHYLLSQPMTWMNVGLMFLTAVFIGTRYRGVNNIVHECSHSSFSSNRDDNVALGRLCSALRFGCFREYKDDHLSHHAHLGDYEHDAEFRVIENLRLHEDLSISTILRLLAAPLLGLHLKAYSGVNFSAKDGPFFFGLKIFFLIALIVFLVVQPLTAIFFVIVPLFLIFPTINF